MPGSVCQEGTAPGDKGDCPGCCWRCRGRAGPPGSSRALLHKGQRCLGQHPAPSVFPWVLPGRGAEPGVPHLVQHPNLSPRGVGGCEQGRSILRSISERTVPGSAGVPCTSRTSTSLLARTDFCLPRLDLGCETPRGGTWVTSLSPLPAATALFCIGVSGQPALVSVQPVGC